MVALALCALLGAAALVVPGAVSGVEGGALTPITIAYPTRSGASWPMYVAAEGGYYAKYGLDATLSFGVHPAGVAMLVSGQAQMANYGIDPALIAISKDGSLVLCGSSLNRGSLALIARSEIPDVSGLRGKRIAVGRVGDTPYYLTVSLLQKFGLGPRDVNWVPSGLDATARAAVLPSGQADAALLTPPAYFKLQEQGFRSIAELGDYADIYASTVYMFKKVYLAEHPDLPKRLIQAHAEAIQRFYTDKEFAVRAYLAHDPVQTRADVEHIYDIYSKAHAFERVPYVLAAAVQAGVARADPNVTDLQGFDFSPVIDQSAIDELVREGFFERVFGPDVKAEQERQRAQAFGK